jgi:tetratricopeptide (TPR) repeat protein/MinD-like ATPase involved in chromosome partitioning or flagellar assembly
MESLRRDGRVITFYSYKGGTGRSMALANIAWILAAAGKRVLAIDWDFEAPGLHRYFKPFLLDHELSSSDGLIDLIDQFASAAISPPPDGQELADDWWLPLSDFSDHVLAIDFPHFPAGGKIDLLPAGRQSSTYAVKVSAFNWQNFYDRLGGGGFMDAVRRRAKADYDYVLIDSRTGVSDTAGICTAQMPDTLVVCFTYNNQSIRGAAAVAASARLMQAELAADRQRREVQAFPSGSVPDTPVPYRVFPVPMRVDSGESDRLALRQNFARQVFADLLAPAIVSNPGPYWADVEVPHRVFYAYEEILAPFKDDAYDPKTVLSAFVRMARHLSDGEVADYRLPLAPEVRQSYLEAFAETPQTSDARRAAVESRRESDEEAMVREADAALLSLPEDERHLAWQALCRLVRVGREEEGGGVYPIRVPIADFDEPQRGVVANLARLRLLGINTTERRPGPRSVLPNSAGGRTAMAEQTVGFRDERLVGRWPALQRLLAEDRDFLFWRQQLRDYRADWLRTGEPSALLSGSLLAEAKLRSRQRPFDLNLSEQGFIDASVAGADLASPPAAAPVAAPPANPDAKPVWPATKAALPHPVFGDGAAPVDDIFAEPVPSPQAAAEVDFDPFSSAPAAVRAAPAGAAKSAEAASARAPAGPAPYAAQATFNLLAQADPLVVNKSAALPPRLGIVLGILAAGFLILVAGALIWRPSAPNPAITSAPPPPASAATSAASWVAQGDQLATAGLLTEAAAAYQKAVDADPTQVDLWLKLGRTLDQAGDYAHSRPVYDRAVQLAPQDARPLIERAASLMSQNRFEDALTDLGRASALDDKSSTAHVNRGAALENLSRFDEAITEYSAALKLQPTLASALLRRASLLEKTGKQAAAIEDYQQIVALNNDPAAVLSAQARLQALVQADRAASGGTATRRVFVHYSAPGDRSEADYLRRELKAGLGDAELPPAQEVNPVTAGVARYFFPGDRPLAEAAQKQAAQALAQHSLNIPLALQFVDAKRFPKARPGTVEIWLPPLTVVAPTRSELPPNAQSGYATKK